MSKQAIIQTLIERGNELLQRPFEKVPFTKNAEADSLMNDLAYHPHAFVLSSVMDRQIKAERAWMIPYLIKQDIGSFDFKHLCEFDLGFYKELFRRRSLHRFNDTMAGLFYDALQLLDTKYSGDASLIWKGTPQSATIVLRFLEFKGIGVKIATMATNILSREFKIPMQDRICIDISPDVQVKSVFTRLGFIAKDASNDQLIYTAREFHPEYPGIFDLSAWEIGRKWYY